MEPGTELRIEQEMRQERPYTSLLKQCPAMAETLKRLAKCSASDRPLLVEGETGSGKEIASRAAQELSPRCEEVFVVANCAGQTENFIDSELFGHEKGAYTGAVAKRIGRFESADRGTLFLDEIGELSNIQQQKLLRVVEGYPFTRVGGTEDIEVNVRIISATNRDLMALVKNGTFREDLYYRINVLPVKVPPLRERPEDIAVLARYFIDKSKNGSGRIELGTESLRALFNYSWPGNVRELRNAIYHAMVLLDGAKVIEPEHLPENIHRPLPLQTGVGFERHLKSSPDLFAEIAALTDTMPLTELVGCVERVAIERSLKKHQSQRKAAEALGLNRQTLVNKIKKLGCAW